MQTGLSVLCCIAPLHYLLKHRWFASAGGCLSFEMLFSWGIRIHLWDHAGSTFNFGLVENIFISPSLLWDNFSEQTSRLMVEFSQCSEYFTLHASCMVSEEKLYIKRFIYLKDKVERQRERERASEKESSSIHWLPPEMATMVDVSTGWSQELLPSHPIGVTGCSTSSLALCGCAWRGSMIQVFGPLLPKWETWIKLLAPCFKQVQPRPVRPLWYLSFALSNR